MRTRTCTTLIATAAALALPTAASASTIEVTASSGPAASDYLEYRASKGESNRVRVLFARNAVVIVDRSTKRIRPKPNAGFPNCRPTSRQRVVCPDFPLSAFLRDGNDRFSVAPGDTGAAPTSTDPLSYAASYEDDEGAVTLTTFVDAGSGNDFVSGSKFDDVIRPGTGLDRVEGRDGPDEVELQPDGVTDRIIGGGGIDEVSFQTDQALLVDLAARTGGPPGDPDTLAYVERFHGGFGNDDIRGTAGSEALYGEGGNDRVDGRGGHDLVVGESLVNAGATSPDTLIAGEGDDITDTRAWTSTPTSTVDCGPGNDRQVGAADTLLDPSCESVLLRIPSGSLPEPASEDVLYDDPMKAAPVAKTTDTITFEVPCPQRSNVGCSGTIVLEAPPVAGSSDPPTHYGIGEFGGPPGRGNVTVGLNAAGQAAVAGNQPVAVRLDMQLDPPSSSTIASRARLGWQADL